jgi:transcriptional regulator with XRE-family HTH domain
MDLATTLKDFRRDNGLEQDDLAKLLDTTQQTVSNWESGTMPRTGALKKITHLLNNYKKDGYTAPSTPAPAQAQSHGNYPTFSSTMLGADEFNTRRRVAESLVKIVDRGPHSPAFSFLQDFKGKMLSLIPAGIPHEQEALIKFQGVQVRADYLTRQVCAEIKYSAHPISSPIFDIGILQLNTIRAIHKRQGELRGIYMLIIATQDITSLQQRTTRLLNLAALHEIQIFIATTPEECAKLLIALEHGSPPDDDFSEFPEG